MKRAINSLQILVRGMLHSIQGSYRVVKFMVKVKLMEKSVNSHVGRSKVLAGLASGWTLWNALVIMRSKFFL